MFARSFASEPEFVWMLGQIRDKFGLVVPQPKQKLKPSSQKQLDLISLSFSASVRDG